MSVERGHGGIVTKAGFQMGRNGGFGSGSGSGLRKRNIDYGRRSAVVRNRCCAGGSPAEETNPLALASSWNSCLADPNSELTDLRTQPDAGFPGDTPGTPGNRRSH